MDEQFREAVGDFKYLGNIISKDGSLTRKVEERVKPGRKRSGVLKAVIRNKNVSTEVTKTWQDSVLFPAML